MSKKHFDEYYKTVCNQYSEMLEALHEVEELTMQQMIGPDRLDNIKRQIEPLKNNYMTLSYVAFLLNKPNRDKKEKRYVESNKKKLLKLDFKRSPSGVVTENQRIINDLRQESTIFVLLGNKFI